MKRELSGFHSPFLCLTSLVLGLLCHFHDAPSGSTTTKPTTKTTTLTSSISTTVITSVTASSPTQMQRRRETGGTSLVYLNTAVQLPSGYPPISGTGSLTAPRRLISCQAGWKNWSRTIGRWTLKYLIIRSFGVPRIMLKARWRKVGNLLTRAPLFSFA